MISAELRTSASPSPRISHGHRALVERVLASEAFSQSKRLSSLLAYLCDMTFAGRAEELSEQRVGEAVFGRSRHYDTMADSIVRTQASRLRTRLDLYFSAEGSAEPVRITIPRGSYAPLFEPHSEQDSNIVLESPVEAQSPASPPSALYESAIRSETTTGLSTRSSLHLLHHAGIAWGIAACGLAGFLVMLFVVHSMPVDRPQRSLPSVPGDRLWSQIFTPGQTALLVPGDSSLVIYQGIKGRNLSLDEYVSGAYRDFHPTLAGLDDASATNLASRRYTSLVDLEIAVALSRIARERNSALKVRYPRELRANDLKQGSLVLVGAAEADPWVTLLERGMNFTFQNDRAKHIMSVYNRSPRGNEPREWDSASIDPQHRVYSVVAWMPNLSGNGHVLLIEGTTMAGTECAWDFVNDDTRLNSFLRKIRRPDGSLPAFELLLDASNIAGSASQSSILAYRIH